MTTFYRKYRPQKISELDLDVVRETLRNSLKDGKFAQAYLFVGPRGAGKTSAARIIAKVVNCLDLKAGEPCLSCEMCKSIEAGSAVDVMEIDAASHRGIDAIRELKDKIGLAPVQAKKKVYIIDEVHMLTTEAFNALLKTLEEPPEHVLFVLCTTEAHKVPETIKSRCVKVGFSKGSVEEVLRSLKKVVEGEKLEVTEEALKELAHAVDGSFREGHKLLEQLVAGGVEISVETVRKLLGQAEDLNEKRLAKLLLSGETKLALIELMEVEKKGINLQIYSEAVLDYLRLQLKAKYGIGKAEVQEPVSRIKMVVGRLANACVEMKTAVVEILPLELVAVEVSVSNQEPVTRKVQDPVVLEQKPEIKGEIKTEKVVVGSVEEVKEIEPARVGEQEQETGSVNVSLDEVLSKWGGLIALLEPQNHSVAGLLRSCRPKKIENKFLIVEAYYKFHKEQLEQDARRRMVEVALKQQTGLPSVKFVLGERASAVVQKLPEHDNVGVPSGDDKLIEAVGDVFGVEI